MEEEGMRGIIVAVAALAAGGILAVLLSACSGSLYKPGSAAKLEVRPEGNLQGPEGRLEVGNGVELYWFAQGNAGGRPVIMVHGGPGYPFKEPWKALDSLDDGRRFIYYHQRGSGKSTRPVDRFQSKNFYKNMKELDAKLGMATQLRDIEALRLASGAEKISLIGHSYGGLLAALYAVEYPAHIDRLVLVAPAEVARMPIKKSSGLYGVVREKLPGSKRADYDDFLKRFFDYGKLFDKSERELQELNFEFIGFFEEAFPSMRALDGCLSVEDIAGWEPQALFLSLGRQYDLSKAFIGIKVPTLIITGSSDFTSEAEILDTYGKIPNATHRVLPTGHFAFEEDERDFARVVGDFLDGK
jgi:proline iminopeptidase